MSTRQSGQPNKVYDYPKNVADYIRKKLGASEGMITFLHKLSFADGIMDMTEMILTYDKRKLLRRKLDGKPVVAKLPKQNVDIARFIWHERGWIVTRLHENEFGAMEPDEDSEEYWMVRPPIETDPNYRPSQFLEIERVPSLKSLKPRDELSSDSFLIRTPAVVPVSLAYRYEDPIQLSKVGLMQKEYKGKIYDMFEKESDIENSHDFTKDLGRNYYDSKIEFLFDQWYKVTLDIRVVADEIANEIDGFNLIDEDEETEEKIPYRDVSKLE